ncbi:MAG: Kazal-type serine protease inhibitor domain-containing protein, partial [Candidatus Pacearchaeota archaeon]
MKEKSLINPVLIIFLLIFLYLFFFFLLYPFYNKGITANIVFQPYPKQEYYPGEKLKGNLFISLNKNNTHKDLIPVNATFEIYVEGINVKNLTFAEIINLSDQVGKGNLSFGVFRNVNGKAPAQKGWGFTWCEFLPPPPPPQINTNKSEKPAKLTATTSCSAGQIKEFLCPDGINIINQKCICEAINITLLTQRCYWSPSDEEALQQCINKYSCFSFSNIYTINLEKLNIPLIDKDENGEANITFRLIYRWETPWNFSNPICRMAQQIPPNQPNLPYITICTNYAINWSPVCGIDNITYPNACFAICQGNTQVSCYRECQCPSIPQPVPPKEPVNFSIGVPPPYSKIHEVEINSIETNVSIKNIECSWNYACINNTEYNKTKKVWLIYKGENSRKKCLEASIIASGEEGFINPIIDPCPSASIDSTFGFSIYCYSYNEVIKKLV